MSDQAFDRTQFKALDRNLRGLVEEHHNFCLHKCGKESFTGLASCKEECFNRIIVPYRFINHRARDDEDNHYKKCLSEKLPNIQEKDYFECSQKLYRERFLVLSQYFFGINEALLNELH